MAKLQHRLTTLHLSDEVVKTALKIHVLLPETLNKMKENARIYLIATEAYKTLGLLYEPEELQETLNLSEKCAKDTIKDAARSGYQLVIHQYQPTAFVSRQLYIAGIDESHSKDVTLLLEKLLKHYPDLYEENPRQVCAGVMVYYAMITGFEINLNEFCGHCKSPTATTKKIKTLVERLDNQQ